MDFLDGLLDAAHITGTVSQNAALNLAVALAIQTLFAVPSIVAQSEVCYDLSGALTFLICTALSLYRPHRHLFAEPDGNPALNWRQLAASCAVCIWSLRRELPTVTPECLKNL